MVEVSVEARGVGAAWAKRVVEAVLRHEEERRWAVSVLVTGDKRIRALNKKHLKHDYATDVISFGLQERLGAVVVSADTARRYARENGLAWREELARYLVHGTLHLLGYDDTSPAKRRKMFARQELIVKRVVR
jgi:probable rRNA maturation factor